jgi:hypothetical protein
MVQKAVAMVYPVSMHAISAVRPGRMMVGWRLALWAGLVATGLAAAGQEPAWRPPSVLTNVAQLRRFNSQEPGTGHLIRLEGNVWWVSPDRKKLVLNDASGAVELELNLPGHPVQPGQRVRLEGSGTITRRGADIKIGQGEPAGNPGLPLQLEVIGREAFPEMRWLAIGQTLRDGDEDSWAEVEGKVTLATEQPDGLLDL